MLLTDLLQAVLCLSLHLTSRKPWWQIIPEDIRPVFLLVLFFVDLLVLSFVLYLAGLIVVGKKRALWTDAFVISLLGTVLSTLFLMFVPYPLLPLVLSIVVWLLLIKRLYETGWLGSIAVGILAVVIYLAVAVILALLFGVLEVIFELFERLFSAVILIF